MILYGKFALLNLSFNIEIILHNSAFEHQKKKKLVKIWYNYEYFKK
jgi:hypothetical protein